MPKTATAPITWEDLVRLEPRLADLEAWVRRIAAESRCPCGAFEGWGGRRPAPKDLLRELAGWTARRQELRTSAAYDAAMDRMLGLLGPCCPMDHERKVGN